MIRNIERLPQRIYLFAALLLIAACLLMSLLPRAASDPIQSAKSVLQAIPLYPGATRVFREDTDTPRGTIDHQYTNCTIECARVTYEAHNRPEMVIRFYESHASKNRWRSDPSPPGGRSYYFGPHELVRWHLFEQDWPLFHPQYEMRRDYIIDVRTEEKARGISNVELIVRRLAPMPSDTPIPTLVPPPPTAPIPIVPGSVRTQEPNIPISLPTVR